jgi:hypothetical protein
MFAVGRTAPTMMPCNGAIMVTKTWGTECLGGTDPNWAICCANASHRFSYIKG